MKSARFKECLAILHWSSLTLVDVLKQDAGTIVAWFYGREPVPDAIGEWLETLVRAHEAAPPPEELIQDDVRNRDSL